MQLGLLRLFEKQLKMSQTASKFLKLRFGEKGDKMKVAGLKFSKAKTQVRDRLSEAQKFFFLCKKRRTRCITCRILSLFS